MYRTINLTTQISSNAPTMCQKFRKMKFGWMSMPMAAKNKTMKKSLIGAITLLTLSSNGSGRVAKHAPNTKELLSIDK